MYRSVLIVCIGNICRSPMAEALMRASLEEQHRPAPVASAGLAALVGAPPEPVATELMDELGIDISAHRARQITVEDLKTHDLILVMDREQQRQLEKWVTSLKGRVFRLGHWDDDDIDDPFMAPREAFVEALDRIRRGVHRWIPYVSGP
ncbi:MAG: low molecular weight protein-tyrosine-phosphatase [Pseudomonadota bacterium]